MANIRNHWIQPAICSYCEEEFPIRYDNRMEKLRKEGKLFCSDNCRKSAQEVQQEHCKGKTIIEVLGQK